MTVKGKVKSKMRMWVHAGLSEASELNDAEGLGDREIGGEKGQRDRKWGDCDGKLKDDDGAESTGHDGHRENTLRPRERGQGPSPIASFLGKKPPRAARKMTERERAKARKNMTEIAVRMTI